MTNEEIQAIKKDLLESLDDIESACPSAVTQDIEDKILALCEATRQQESSNAK